MKTYDPHAHSRSRFSTPVGRAARAAVALALVLQAGALAPPAHGYAADGSGGHSTFHFDMTRVLALAAGVKDYEYLAVATEAVDNGTFQNGDLRVTIVNAERFYSRSRNNSYYFHWARRGDFYPPASGATGECPQPSADTCAYFKDSPSRTYESKPCAGVEGTPIWELYEIRDWAVGPSGNISQPESNLYPMYGPVASRERVKARSLESLAIYLHALGDSYAHDECMCAHQKRAHTTDASACATAVHRDDELGAGFENVPTTKIAAAQVWKALLNFCQQNGGFCGAAKWPDANLSHTEGAINANAEAFINHFVGATKSGAERESYAECVVKSLQKGDDFQTACAGDGGSSGSRGRAAPQRRKVRRANRPRRRGAYAPVNLSPPAPARAAVGRAGEIRRRRASA